MSKTTAERNEEARRRWAESRRQWSENGTAWRVGMVSWVTASGLLLPGLLVPPLLAVVFVAFMTGLVAATVNGFQKRRQPAPDLADAPTITLAVVPELTAPSREERRAERAAQREAKREHARTHYTVMMDALAPRLTVDAEAGTLRRGSEKRGEVRSMAGVTISMDITGGIGRRTTLTRAAVLGPFALAAKKKTDSRTLYVTIDGPDFQWSWQIEGSHGSTVRAYMARVTTSVREWQSGVELRDPARAAG